MAGTRVATRAPVSGAEGERFELSIRLTTDNGFRDRRIRPLCHPSSGEGGIRTLDGEITPHNALAGRRLQPLGPFSGARIVSKECRRYACRGRARPADRPAL